MNRLISSVVAAVVAAIAMSVAGFFQSRGFVAIGDARIPSEPLAWLGIVASSITGLAAGGAMPLKTMLVKTWEKLKSFIPSPGTSVPAVVEEKRQADADFVPVEVEHLHRCVYHLRCLLRDDEEAQELIDKIAVKMGRATANIESSGEAA